MALGAWVTEPGAYDLLIGTSAEEIAFTIRLCERPAERTV